MLKKISASKRIWLPLLFALLALTMVNPPRLCSLAEAASTDHDDPKDYCYRISVTITEQGSTARTNYPVVVPMNSGQLVSQSLLDSQFQDLYTTTSGYTEVYATVQNVTNNTGDDPASNWWITVPSLTADGTAAIYLHMGNQYINRDQGFWIDESADTITVSDHADLDITDNLGIQIRIEESDPTQDAWFVSKWTANTGYRIGSTAAGNLRAQVNDQALDVTFDGNEWVRVRFINPTLTIDYLDTVLTSPTYNTWVQQGTSNTGLGSITANAQALVMGGGAIATGYMLYDVEVQDNVNTAPAIVARWGFDPGDVTQTATTGQGTAGNSWTWTGTVTDQAVGHDGSYSLTRNQDAAATVSVAVGPVATTFADAALTVSERFRSVFGTALETDAFNSTDITENVPAISLLIDAQLDSGFPEDAFWVMVGGAVAIMLAIPIFLATREFAFVAAVPGAVFLTLNVMGLLDPWFTVIYGFVAGPGIFLMRRWARG